MKLFNIDFRDIGYHFRKNSGYYLTFVCIIFVSLIVGLVIVFSSDGYLSLLVSKNKNLYNYINGTIKFNEIFLRQLIKFLYPIIIILIFGLNFYLCKLCYLFVGYQFVIFIMTISAMISVYTFSAVIVLLLFIIPINIIYFLCLIFVSVVCLERSYYAKRTKYFKEGYNKNYFFKIILAFIIITALVLIISFVFPLLLKSAIFFVF